MAATSATSAAVSGPSCWERFAGQVVQAVLAVIVLVALPSPVRRVDADRRCGRRRCGLGVVLAIRALPQRGASRWARTSAHGA